MPNTSATGGYLIPENIPASIDDIALEDLLQPAIAGITGITPNNVRPRFQEGNAKIPDQSVDWCAFAITNQMQDDNPHVQHAANGLGDDTLTRHEDFEVFISFYGRNAGKNAARLRDGIYINQNIEMLNQSEISFVNAGEIKLASELVNQKWIRRNDLTMYFRRKIIRKYPILNIVAADIHLVDDSGRVDEMIEVVDAGGDIEFNPLQSNGFLTLNDELLITQAS